MFNFQLFRRSLISVWHKIAAVEENVRPVGKKGLLN